MIRLPRAVCARQLISKDGIQRKQFSSLHCLRNGRFEPLRPPTPSSLGKPAPPKEYLKTRKWARRLFRSGLAVATIWGLDVYLYDSSLSRSFRTFSVGLLVALDYQINFRPDPWIGQSAADVHARAAHRVFNLLRENGGLYLKIGQAIAMQSAILPPEFQKMFAKMFDDAPQNSWKDVEEVVREDFGGRSVEEVFGVGFTGERGKGAIEKKARASASVAQVHWARLTDGREVAIKVQKREIARQVGWDLWAFGVVSKVYTWWFDLPLYHLVPYVSERLMLETDFQNEAKNAEEMRRLVQGERRLRDCVYVPKVYNDLSSKRVLTAEWIEGVRLWDKEGITGKWYGGYGKGSPGAGGQPLGKYQSPGKPPRDAWRGPNGNGGLGLSLRDVMQTMVDLFSAQMFLWGVVHCDPHPGNIFIRRLPAGKPELVLIDHGLYIHMSDKFRRQYALFWRSLITMDHATVERIARDDWGIDAPELFASATLLRPYEGGQNSISDEIRRLSKTEQRHRQYEMQQQMRKGIKQVLANQDKFPQELVFIGRNMRIVQGNNQFLGSPVNRIKITGIWASRALAEDRQLATGQHWQQFGLHLATYLSLFALDVIFYLSKLKQMLGFGRGPEDDLEQTMKNMAQGVGVELQHGVFEG
ncbi:ABC1-domain-containing protein [Piedraia hortae CBS 480.64]|uniref:ABC1-domain-containing protein n=1 Tax=Piedraia hortae CBS 480.64 TaxID=1314780 RepID=A0A6A7C2P2_9PEZI|nr:ABC1-domain-containing protein [Piedraia hortae CBS 480.64]